MWSHSFTKHSGGPQGLWAGPGLLRINGCGIGSQSSQHRGRLKKWFQIGELLIKTQRKELLLPPTRMSIWNDAQMMSFYSKAGNLCEVLLLFSYLLLFSHKPEAYQGCELLPLIGVGGSEVGSCLLLHLGLSTLQTAQHVLKLLHLGLSTLQTAQHALKLPLVSCLSISLPSTAQKNWVWKPLSDEW